MRDWESQKTDLLLNPKISQKDRKSLELLLENAPDLSGHIWIASSGSTSSAENPFKLIALGKNAFLASGRAVNAHLKSDANDIWLHGLPDFHVGGLNIWARAYLSGAQVVSCYSPQMKWDPHFFYKQLCQTEASLTSLVPTQLCDIIHLGYQSPLRLRAVLVGGGALDGSLYQQSRLLGWPVLPTYGMSECCSQVATASLKSLEKETLNFPTLEILPHFKVKSNSEGLLVFSGPALFSGYAFFKEGKPFFHDPKKEGWWVSEDVGEVLDNSIKFHHRQGEQIKISGEIVNLRKLRGVLEKITAPDAEHAALIARPDPRRGFRIVLLFDKEITDPEKKMESFNQDLLPFERAQIFYRLPYLPRSPLGKLLNRELEEMLCSIEVKG